MVNLSRLAAFVAVAEELNFGRAATRLHLSQPALSRQIRVLEEELGTQLLARNNRRVALTPAGVQALADFVPHISGGPPPMIVPIKISVVYVSCDIHLRRRSGEWS